MQFLSRVFIMLCCFHATPGLEGESVGPLEAHLEPLRPLLGKTWKGSFKDSDPAKPMVDVQRWERILNGAAIRIVHSVNDGVYGGESIVRWDSQQQTVVYHYFTTAGFMTIGRMTLENGRMITHESVSGGAGGATEVRGTSELKPDGTFSVKTEYLVGGVWQPGREVAYRQVPDARIIFK